jgi:AcrR family transcriptional regulator
MAERFVVRNGIVLPVAGARVIYDPGSVLVEGDRIVAVGPAGEVDARAGGARVVDATGHAVLPGLHNAHLHSGLLRGTAEGKTLRGVARAVGVAATSVYLHFADVESLVLEVARRGFGELRAAQDAAMDAVTGPCERLRAGSLAYCEWGLANPGHYQWMFANPLRISAATWEGLPGQPLFAGLVATVAECLGRPATDPESALTARLLWHLLHGMISLRIAWPFLPWPPIPETVDEAVSRLVAPVSTPSRSRT